MGNRLRRSRIHARAVVLGRAADRVGVNLAGAAGVGRLEVAAQAEVGIARDEHLRVHGAVRVVAGDAALAHRGVLIDKRALLLRVALGAGGVHVLEVHAGAGDGVALVHVVAIAAAHLAVEHLVAVRQAELGALVEVALEAGLGRLLGIEDVPLLPPAATWRLPGP